MQQLDENQIFAYRKAMGMMARPGGGTDVIHFPAAWMGNSSKRVQRPEIELDDTRLVNSHDLSGYTFCPIRLAKWAVAVLRLGQSVTGLYPKTYGMQPGRFLIKRTGNAVLGYCEIGTHHYVFRPDTIHRYDLPYYYQRPMAELSLDGFMAMYPDDEIWRVDASAKEVYLFGQTSPGAPIDWYLATLDSANRHATLPAIEDQVMPVNPHVMRGLVIRDLEKLTRLLRIMLSPHNLFANRNWRMGKWLEAFDHTGPGGRSWQLGYEESVEISRKVKELMDILATENDRITSGAPDVIPWLESTLKEAATYIKQRFGANYSRALKKGEQ